MEKKCRGMGIRLNNMGLCNMQSADNDVVIAEDEYTGNLTVENNKKLGKMEMYKYLVVDFEKSGQYIVRNKLTQAKFNHRQ